MRVGRLLALGLIAAAIPPAACTGDIDPAPGGDGPAAVAGTPLPGAGGAGVLAPGANGGRGGGGDAAPAACVAGAATPALRRLGAVEYANTVADLFPDVPMPPLSLPADDAIAGFAAQTAPLGDDTLPAYVDAAYAIAGAATAPARRPLGTCDPAAAGEEACVRRLLDTLGARAWRRPLDGSEKDDFVTRTFRPARAAVGLSGALEQVIARLLLAPEFLYHLEFGTPAPELGAGARRLTGAEIASRLSYLLLRRPPDDALARAAAAGELADPARRAEHARRLLRDERALATIWDFHRQWLQIDRLDEITKDPKVFPQFDEPLRASMNEETRRFVAQSFSNTGGTLRELLLGRSTFVDARMAALYGLPAAGAAWRAVELPAAGPRAGILGQASFLTAQSTPRDSSVIFRGAVVRRSLLCLGVPPPPAEVNAVPTVDRQHTQPCAGCHTLIDPIGQALEVFDGLGRQRATVAGSAVDAAGELRGTSDVDGPVVGPLALAESLARSRDVRGCMVTQWLRFALAREPGDGDACLQRALTDAQGRAGAGLLDLALAYVQSDDFVVRRESPITGGACP